LGFWKSTPVTPVTPRHHHGTTTYLDAIFVRYKLECVNGHFSSCFFGIMIRHYSLVITNSIILSIFLLKSQSSLCDDELMMNDHIIVLEKHISFVKQFDHFDGQTTNANFL